MMFLLLYTKVRLAKYRGGHGRVRPWTLCPDLIVVFLQREEKTVIVTSHVILATNKRIKSVSMPAGKDLDTLTHTFTISGTNYHHSAWRFIRCRSYPRYHR